MLDSTARIPGTLHIDVALDWGDEVDLAHAQRLVPAKLQALARRPRTPSSFAYRPAPLRFTLSPVRLDLPVLGSVDAAAEATVFDFAAVSVAMRVPLDQTPDELRRLAGGLANSEAVVQRALAAIEPLYRELLPAIGRPHFSALNEEYFVFQFPPGGPLPPPSVLLDEHAGWLAGLVRLEADALSDEEIADTLRQRLSYTPDDLLVPTWSAAVLIDRDCEETLQIVEFANLQLLEFRHTDQRLDDQVAEVSRLIHPLARSPLPFWRTQARQLRALGDLKVEAHAVFERTSNVLKLVGDHYLARAYRLLSARFHLDDWSQSIRHSLDVVEGVYQVLSDQAATYRTEVLEIIIILLIFWEIVAAWLRP